MNAQSVCNDAPAMLTVTTPQNDFDVYEWTPVAGLYTDPAATVPYTGGSAVTVYARTPNAGTYNYSANALNTTTGCGGVDTTEVHVQPPGAVIYASSVCFTGATTLKLMPDKGYAPQSIRWQTSPDQVGWVDVPGASGVSYTTPILTNSVYYRALILNSQGQTCFTVVDTARIINPAITGVIPGARCGYGSVTLHAEGTPGSLVAWYDAPAGGMLLDTGTTFETPMIGATTTYYVVAEQNGLVFGGLPYHDELAAPVTNAVCGLSFDALVPFTLNTVKVYINSVAAGTVTIELLDGIGAPVEVAVLPVPSGQLINGVREVILPINFQVPAGNDLRLLLTGRTGGFNPLAEGAPVSFPVTTPGVMSVKGGLLSATGGANTGYYVFYDWNISVPCNIARVPVAATVTPPPPITVSPSVLELCLGDTARFGVASPNTEYSYYWTPGHTIASDVELIPTTDMVYRVYATDSSGGVFHTCAAIDSVVVIVHPLPSAQISYRGGNKICEDDSVILSATTGLGYQYQWIKDNSVIQGADNSIYAATSAGRYSVWITDNSLCTARSSVVEVTSHSRPVPVVYPGGNGMVRTDHYVAYQWLYDSIPIPGATQQEYAPIKDGRYSVMVTDDNGCTGLSAAYAYHVGLSTVATGDQPIKIYPNPARELVFVHARGAVNLVVTDLGGRSLIRLEQTDRADISGLPDGIYLISVYDSSGNLLTFEKLVKSSM